MSFIPSTSDSPASTEYETTSASRLSNRRRSGNSKTETASTVHILYGTTTGNSEILAKETAEKLEEKGIVYRVQSTEEFNTEELYQIDTLLILMSTDCDGDPPMMAKDFYNYLYQKEEADLGHLSFGVLSLGDSYYPDFCQAGKDIDRMLENLGGHRIAKRVDCDMAYWDDFDEWLENICTILEEIF